VNSQRTNLKSKYPDFVTFKKNFKADQAFMDAFLAHVEKEKADLKFNAEEFELSKKLIQTRLKAEIAQNLWDYSEFYEIYNSRNEILQKAINILQTKEYLKLNLDRN
jgi:carboxyl-terminal processing protease